MTSSLSSTGAFLGLNPSDSSLSLSLSSNTFTSYIGRTTFTAGSSLTSALSSSLYIKGPPIAGTNITLTSTNSLYVETGNSYLGGNLTITGTETVPNILCTTRIGLGTTGITPLSALHIEQDASGNEPVCAITFKEKSFNDSFYIGAGFGGTGDSNKLLIGSSIVSANPVLANSKMCILASSGNVGIGNVSPSEKLHVTGNILSSAIVTSSNFRSGSGANTSTSVLMSLGSGQTNTGGGTSEVPISLSFFEGGYSHFIRTRHNSSINMNSIDFYLNTSATSTASTPPTGSTITNTGNILGASVGAVGLGLGILNATEKLHVVGNSIITGLSTLSGGINVSTSATFTNNSYSDSVASRRLTGHMALKKGRAPKLSSATAVKNVSTWNTRTSATDNDWRSVCWSPELSLFVSVSDTGTGNRVMTSPDGITWTSRTSAADNRWFAVCWSSELSLFVSVSISGTGNRVMTSPDGITWTIRTSAADNQWLAVCWSPELSLFVAVGTSSSGNNGVMTSPNGTTWTSRTSASDNSWYSVCWSPELSLFVAVSISGTGNRVMTSPNGTTWTSRTSAADNQWYSVCWSPELSLFVSVANNGTGNRVMTSPDGTTWTSRTSAADNAWYSVCWSPELSVFVAVSFSGTGNRVMTSPDGIAWTIRTSPADNLWNSICWSPELSLFVAVSFNGTGNRVMTSSMNDRYPTALNVYQKTARASIRSFSAAAVTAGNRVNYNGNICTARDLNVNLAAGTVTILYNGTYKIKYSGYSNNDGGTLTEISLRKNGTQITRVYDNKIGSTYSGSLAITSILDLVAGDVIDIFVENGQTGFISGKTNSMLSILAIQ